MIEIEYLKEPKIMISEKRLTILLARDEAEDKYCALCPELDMVTEMDTADEALEDMVDAIKEYAEEYMAELELYSKSPNRAHHLPYIKEIASCKTDWELWTLLEIRHGIVYI
ncbi:MAG: hypothetical protein HZA07_00680 [Nitrospirae bacterium]|nr:hypothetical protein [Nitrospirota bacterium]